jgi:hypothetical protein
MGLPGVRLPTSIAYRRPDELNWRFTKANDLRDLGMIQQGQIHLRSILETGGEFLVTALSLWIM